MMVGAGVSATSLCLAAWAVHGGVLLPWPLGLAQFGMGLGMGLCGPQLSNSTLQDVPMSDAGVAAGMFTAVQQIAAALGVALAGLLFFHGAPTAADAAQYYAHAYLQVLPLFACLLAAAIFGTRQLDKVMRAGVTRR
jgi:hypothetical protein